MEGYFSSLIISLLWSTFTTIIGINDQRIWNSFFLQYLWEFVLEMKLAELYYKHPENIKIPSLQLLIFTACIGIILTGIKGGWFKVFNDILSLRIFIPPLNNI